MESGTVFESGSDEHYLARRRMEHFVKVCKRQARLELSSGTMKEMFSHFGSCETCIGLLRQKM